MMTVGIPVDRLVWPEYCNYRAELEREIICGLMKRQADWLRGWMKQLLSPQLFALVDSPHTEDRHELANWLLASGIYLLTAISQPGVMWLMCGTRKLGMLSLFETQNETQRWERGYGEDDTVSTPKWDGGTADLGTDPATGMKWR